MKSKQSLNMPIVGFTSRTTVMLDLDDMGYQEAKYRALETLEKFRLDGFVILQSSPRHYHVVFDRKMEYEECVSVIADVCLYSKSQDLAKWFFLQCIKGEFTLRISKKGIKPFPKIVFRYGKQDKEIMEYHIYRNLIKINLT